MTATTPALLDRSVMPLSELLALCLDGQLYRVGDAFATLTTPETAGLRARAFARSAPPWLIAERGTAAWIHGTRAAPPPRPEVCVTAARRGGRVSSAFACRQRVLAEEEVVLLDGVRVTVPLRTAQDLLLTLPDLPPERAAEVRHLLRIAGASVDELRELLLSSRNAGAPRARERIALVERERLPEPAGVRRLRADRTAPAAPAAPAVPAVLAAPAVAAAADVRPVVSLR